MKSTHKNVNIALMDVGICKTKRLKDKIIERISFIHSLQEDCLLPKHGTVCAEIIETIFQQVRFWDLQILEKDGTTTIDILLHALEWCFYNNVEIIHLSLGTINYFDKKKLEDTISRLLSKGIIIVAAYHNTNIRTYPAIFNGVFGVRQDREGLLKNYQFMFQKQEGFKEENTIVAHSWQKEEDTFSNSYAAPLITGYVAGFIADNPQATFGDVKSFLQNKAVKNIFSTEKIRYVLDNANTNIEIPVLCTINFPDGGIKRLMEFFKVKCYNTLLLQECVSESDSIPLKYYWRRGISLTQVLDTTYRIYKPDAIFVDITKCKNIAEIRELKMDAYIVYRCGRYQFLTGNIQIEVNSLDELFQVICNQF